MRCSGFITNDVTLKTKVKAQVEIKQCMNTLDPEVAYNHKQATLKLNHINARLRKLDAEVIAEERSLFDT